jgi:hypothetical protein
MVNDMYAIYESYKQLNEDRTDLSGLSTGSKLPAQANNTNRFSGNIPSGAIAPVDQGISQDNEEKDIPKDILNLLKSISKGAHKADHGSVIIDCARLRKVLSKYNIKRN